MKKVLSKPLYASKSRAYQKLLLLSNDLSDQQGLFTSVDSEILALTPFAQTSKSQVRKVPFCEGEVCRCRVRYRIRRNQIQGPM